MEERTMRRRRNVFRVCYPHQRCFIYKHILTGLHHNKAHKHSYRRVKILHTADDNKQRAKQCIIEGIKRKKPRLEARGLTSKDKKEEEEKEEFF
jgi:hypothetical protein